MTHSTTESGALKVLLIAPTPPPNGGISRWSVLLLEWLSQRTDIIFSHVDSAPHWRDVYDQKLVKRILGGGIQGVRDMCRVLSRLVFFRPEVIHLTTSAGLAVVRDICVMVLASLFQVGVVYHIHMGRIPELVESQTREWRLLAWAIRMCRNVVVLDENSAAALRVCFGSEKVRIVPNGIDISAGTGTPMVVKDILAGNRPSNRALFLGWVVPTKGCTELVEAWSMINNPDWELVLGGPGDPAYLEKLAVANKTTTIRFLGPLTFAEAAEEMTKSDIFVLPTYSEGFPFVILEAMAAGKPIISTRVGAIPEMLDFDAPNPVGIEAAHRDVASLVLALQKVMSDEPLRKTLGECALKKVTTCYSTKVVFSQLEDIWRESAI